MTRQGQEFSPAFLDLYGLVPVLGSEKLFGGFSTAGNIVTLVFILGFCTRVNRYQATRRTRVFYLSRAVQLVFVGNTFLALWKVFAKSTRLHWLTILQLTSQTLASATSLATLHYYEGDLLQRGRPLCVWWVLRPVLDVPLIWTNLSKGRPPVEYLEELFTLLCLTVVGLASLVTMLARSDDGNTLEETLLTSNQTRSTSGFCLGLTFSWVNQLMVAGTQRQLSQDDLLTLPEDLAAEECFELLWRTWMDQELVKRSLFWTIFSAYGWFFVSIGLLKVMNDIMAFSGPLFLNAIVNYLQTGSRSHQNRAGYWYACGLGAVSVLRGFMGTHYSFLVARLRLKLRAGLTMFVYKKALSVSLAQRNEFSSGEIQTLMSVDAERTINLFASVHELWSLPLQMAIALWMLYTQVQFSFLAGLAVIILLIPVNRWIAVRISRANKHMMLEKDKRVQRMSEMLTHISTVKMYAWERLFAQRIKHIRGRELEHLATRKYLDALCVYFWACTPILFSVLTFGLFTILGHTLDAATVFTSLALFNILISPLNSFPWVITGIVEARVSIQRLHRFFACPDFCSSSSIGDQDTNAAVRICNADFTWSSAEPLILKNISLDVPKGALVVVIGQVGAGKTSLLHAILNEMNGLRGSVHVQGTVALASQTPWIRSETFRENIIFGGSYDPERYNEVLKACSLDVDAAQMPRGDLSEIGERGYNLSGGQKARLSLARAIYQNCDVYLLDDPLSAVDAHVAAWLTVHAIGGPLLQQKTRILCTHHTEILPLADIVVVMDSGCIKSVKKPSSLNLVSSQFEIDVNNQQDVQVDEDPSCDGRPKDFLPLVEEETRLEGRVGATVYRTYAAFTGSLVLAVIIISTTFMQASRNGSDWWLAQWVDFAETDHRTSVKMFLRVLFLLGALNSAFTLSRAFSFAYGGLRAARQVHKALLKNILWASISFFERNPVGRILNRFSSDLYTIDDSLPFIANILLAHTFSLLGILVVLCFVQWIVLVMLLPLAYIYYRVQDFYRKTSRELRRLDSVSRSPVYASFCEALDGASTIRAFKCENMFAAKIAKCVEANQRASFSEIAASLWLSIRLQMMASFLVFFVSIMAIVNQNQGLLTEASTAGLVGLALSYAAPIISLLNDLLTAFAETEKEMVSVERVQQYLTVEPEVESSDASVHDIWPESGDISFDQVKLLYRPDLPPALDGISFKIQSGEKVGIAGRTGAGKSSIFAALFRLRQLSSGSITVDGVDISRIPLSRLRHSLAVVPQNPFLFEGTVRENLDPTGTLSDDLLWQVVVKCHLRSALTSFGGLDMMVRELGESLSLGQRQLLCLARALLKQSRILCLDECTANVDPQTTQFLKQTIAVECQAMTVVTIAHRITTIYDSQRVLILDRGKVVEEGDPAELLARSTSRFCSLARASGELLAP